MANSVVIFIAVFASAVFDSTQNPVNDGIGLPSSDTFAGWGSSVHSQLSGLASSMTNPFDFLKPKKPRRIKVKSVPEPTKPKEHDGFPPRYDAPEIYNVPERQDTKPDFPQLVKVAYVDPDSKPDTPDGVAGKLQGYISQLLSPMTRTFHSLYSMFLGIMSSILSLFTKK